MGGVKLGKKSYADDIFNLMVKLKYTSTLGIFVSIGDLVLRDYQIKTTCGVLHLEIFVKVCFCFLLEEKF